MSEFKDKINYINLRKTNISEEEIVTLFDFDFFSKKNNFQDLIHYANLDFYKIVIKSDFFDPNFNEGMALTYFTRNNLIGKAAATIEHKKFIANNTHNSVMLQFLTKKEFVMFEQLSKHDKIDLSISDNLLLSLSAACSDLRFFNLIIKSQAVVEKINHHFIDHKIHTSKQEILRNIIKIIKF